MTLFSLLNCPNRGIGHGNLALRMPPIIRERLSSDRRHFHQILSSVGRQSDKHALLNSVPTLPVGLAGGSSRLDPSLIALCPKALAFGRSDTNESRSSPIPARLSSH